MQPWALRVFRVVQIGFAVTASALAALLFVTGSARHSPHAVSSALGCASVAALVVLMFEVRFWGWRRRKAAVERALEIVASRDLESHEPVSQRSMDEVVEAYASAHPDHPMGKALARAAARNSVRLCVQGRWQGRDIEIGTVLSPGRRRASTTSYVCVRDRNVRRPFGAMTRGASAALASMFGHSHPLSIGDAGFDAKWLVGGDESVVRAALDAPVRTKLLEIQNRVPWLRAASIQSMPYGVVVRWPGLLSIDGAAFLRDLAVDLHQRLVAPAAERAAV